MNVAINENMKERLVSEGIPERTIRILHNWCDGRIRPVARDENTLREEWGLKDRVVIGYSGNLGRAHLPQEMGHLLRATDRLEGLSWLFIGGGKGVEAVQDAARQVGTEVQFRPYQPLERLSESLSVPDIHLISLDPNCEGLIMPSKYYGVLAVDRPILFLGSPKGAIAREIERHGHGVILDISKPENWRGLVEKAMADHAGMQGRVDPATGHAGLGELRRALEELGGKPS